MRLSAFSFLVLFLFSCAPKVKQEVIPQKDPLEEYRQELRKDFYEFLERGRKIMSGS